MSPGTYLPLCQAMGLLDDCKDNSLKTNKQKGSKLRPLDNAFGCPEVSKEEEKTLRQEEEKTLRLEKEMVSE